MLAGQQTNVVLLHAGMPQAPQALILMEVVGLSQVVLIASVLVLRAAGFMELSGSLKSDTDILQLAEAGGHITSKTLFIMITVRSLRWSRH